MALLLLIACANVSNLMLARASARQREMTVRVALGASRRRLIRQLLTESLLLALTAGVVGTALAYAGLPAILALVPPDTIPDESEIALNTSVLLFALAISALTSIICGLAPALHTAGRDVSNAMREASRSLAGGSRQAITRKVLVVAEIALSLVLLAGSSVLLRTVHRSRPDRSWCAAGPAAGVPGAPRAAALSRCHAPDRLLPGAAAADREHCRASRPWRSTAGCIRSATCGCPPKSSATRQSAIRYRRTTSAQATPEPLASGSPPGVCSLTATSNPRSASRSSTSGSCAPASRIARRSARWSSSGGFKDPPFNLANHSFQIVGVVHDTPNAGLSEPTMPEIYVPFSVTGTANVVVVRTSGDPADVTRSVVSQVYAVDAAQPVTNVATVAQLLKDEEFATPRFNLVLLSVFAIVGLALAVVGVYGVMSNAVAQERQEIGVRMALGADAGTIARMILARGARLLLAGTAIGLLASVAAGRWLAGAVWRVSGVDPLAFAAVAALLMIVGLAACYWPARRAARIDPLLAMRES